jgi:tetratricopeptide (TPR) repeat protein
MDGRRALGDATIYVTRREREVLIELCRPALADAPFAEPASTRQIAAALVVSDAAVKQHLLHLYDKFAIDGAGEQRRLRLANEVLRRGVVGFEDLGSTRGPRPTGPLRAARLAHTGQRWEEAVDLFLAADAGTPLDALDLDRLAESAFQALRHDVSLDARQRAYRLYVDAGDPTAAARTAVWLAILQILRANFSLANGWMASAARLLDGVAASPAHGFHLVIRSLMELGAGQFDAALDDAASAHRVARQFGDRDVETLSLAFQGHALIGLGRVGDGMALLDEAMATAVTGDLGMLATGLSYCRTISACLDLFDYDRANDWIDAIAKLPGRDQHGFPGDCLTHQVAVRIVRGEWAEARLEAEVAIAETERVDLTHAGPAWYELGELRLRAGELADAAEAFRRAHELGFAPQPGLTFLLLEQGDIDAASASIETALASIPGHALGRARLLPARVEVMLAAGDATAARDAATELGMIAEAYPTVALRAAALGAQGAVAAARGERSSLAQLRESWRLWRETPAPFEAARVGVLLARARLAAGDRGGALLEIDAAAAAFERLGARLDLLRARALAEELRGTA